MLQDLETTQNHPPPGTPLTGGWEKKEAPVKRIERNRLTRCLQLKMSSSSCLTRWGSKLSPGFGKNKSPIEPSPPTFRGWGLLGLRKAPPTGHRCGATSFPQWQPGAGGGVGSMTRLGSNSEELDGSPGIEFLSIELNSNFVKSSIIK